MRRIALASVFACLLGVHPAHACDEVSDVTGYRHCTTFGFGWDESPLRPVPGSAKRNLHPVSLPLFVEAAAIMQTVDAGSVTFRDMSSDSHSFSLHNPGLGLAAVYGLDLRAGMRVAGPFYAGLTMRLAFGGLPERATAIADGARVDLGTALGMVAFGGYVGFAVPVSSGARLRFEAAIGFEDPGLLAISGITCSESPCGPDSPRAFVEPHVVMDFWLGRSWSVSPFAGDDVLHPSSVTVGFMTSWHWQRFDGRP